MNKIWSIIIIVSIVFGFINGRIEIMITELFNVPKETLNILLKIGSMLIIYSGLFQIANDANVIKKVSLLIIKPVSKIFKVDDETLDLICASIIANLLGLGPANMTIALKVVDRINNSDKYRLYNLTLYLLLNVSSLCVLPMSTLVLRETFNANINIAFVPMLFIGSLISTVFAIIIVKIFVKEKYE